MEWRTTIDSGWVGELRSVFSLAKGQDHRVISRNCAWGSGLADLCR